MSDNRDFVFWLRVVNASEYDNGNKETSDIYLEFPKQANYIETALEEIGLPPDAEPGQYFIDDYNCVLKSLNPLMDMHTDIHELAEVAKQLDTLDGLNMLKLNAVMESGAAFENLAEVKEFTYNRDYYNLELDISDHTELGLSCIYKSGIFDTIPDYYKDAINPAAFGKYIAEAERGIFTTKGYLYPSGDKWQAVDLPDFKPKPLVHGADERPIDTTEHFAADLDSFYRGISNEYANMYDDEIKARYHIAALVQTGRTAELKEQICNMQKEYYLDNADVQPFLKRIENFEHCKGIEPTENKNNDLGGAIMEDRVFRLRIENNDNKSVWIGFPCKVKDFKDSLTQAGFSSEDMTKFKITGFDAVIPEYDNLSDFLQLREVENTDGYIVRENIDELNYLAILLADLGEPDKAAFCAALEAGEHNKNIKELINLAHNVEYYNVVADISDWADYGKHIALQNGFNIGNIGSIVNFIDFAEYGKHHADDHGGYLLDGIFLETGWTEFVNVYDGNKMNIPFEYRLVNFGLDKDKKDYIPLLGKSPSIYKDIMLLTGLDNKIYVGHKDNIYTNAQGEHFYNNADNSFTFISENEKMGVLLSTLVWGASQNDLKSMGLFSDKDYEEFNKIQTEILSDYTIIQPVSFSGVPFHYPVTEEQQAEKVNRNDAWQRKQIDKPPADLHFKNNSGIISIGNGSTNIMISQRTKTDTRIEKFSSNEPPKPPKPSIKEQLQQTKKEQNKQPPKPPQKPEPEL